MIPIRMMLKQQDIATFCRSHHIRKLALFGSVLRKDYTEDSDIDVVVEFEPDTHIGWDFVTIADELGALMGRQVDLNTPDMLSRYFRDDVLASMQVLYERKG